MADGFTKVVRGGQLALALVLGLGIAEGVFFVKNLGAFPHLNLFVEDEALGVRLVPTGWERIALSGNAISTVNTNSQGFRAPEWPEPGADEVLIVGDGQAFGLGVDDEQAASFIVSRAPMRTVLNAGVPTYGPDEYLAVAEAILAERPVTELVVVVNLADDLTELGQPNAGRSTVRDGWMMPVDRSSTWSLPLPGQDFLYRKSHLFYAARQFYWSGNVGQLPLPSKDTWDGLAAAGKLAEERAEESSAGVGTARKKQNMELGGAIRDLLSPHRAATLAPLYQELMLEAPDALGPNLMPAGAERETVMVDQLTRWAAANASDPRATGVQTFIDGRTKAIAEADALASTVSDPGGREPGPLDAFVRRAADLARAHKAQLTIVAVPLDVQVDEAAWANYGATPQPIASAERLLTELMETARREGARGVSLLEPLNAAGPGAYLSGDPHLSASGQAAMATAITAALAQPAPLRTPDLAIPTGRSLPPAEIEWGAAAEHVIDGSARNTCQAKRVREWLQVRCVQSQSQAVLGAPSGLAIVNAPLEATGWWGPVGQPVTFITPLLSGRDVAVDFLWTHRTEQLTVAWAGDVPTMAFTPNGGPRVASTKGADGYFADVCLAGPEAALGRLDWCLRNRRQAPMSCAEGEANAGSAAHCYPLCSDAVPCVQGVCTDWGGSDVCL